MTRDTSRQLDTRHRISLAGIQRHTRYLIHIDPDGVITLTPAIVLPDNATTRAIDASIADPTTGTRRTRPDRDEAA